MGSFPSGGTTAEILQWAVDFSLHFATEFFVFIVIAGAVAVFALYFGRSRIVPLLAGMYAAIPLYTAFPYQNFLSTPLLHVALYVALALAGFIAFSSLASFVAEGSLGFLNTVILSTVTAGMFIAVCIYILPFEEMYTLSAATKALFAGTQAFFLWLLAPLVAVFFLGRG